MKILCERQIEHMMHNISKKEKRDLRTEYEPESAEAKSDERNRPKLGAISFLNQNQIL